MTTSVTTSVTTVVTTVVGHRDYSDWQNLQAIIVRRESWPDDVIVPEFRSPDILEKSSNHAW